MGREFIEMFDEWAETYDDTVSGKDPQYKDVFANYDDILSEVAGEAVGNVLEFGVGTGNLSEKLLANGLHVTGIEPSPEMREHASRKFPSLTIKDGDFIQFPEPESQISTVVSTWAFHHLTDEEKDTAIAAYSKMLPAGGKVVFADTAFADEKARDELIELEKSKGYDDLVKDLTTEYYTLVSILQNIFQKHGFDVTFKQMNRFVYLMKAVKQ